MVALVLLLLFFILVVELFVSLRHVGLLIRGHRVVLLDAKSGPRHVVAYSCGIVLVDDEVLLAGIEWDLPLELRRFVISLRRFATTRAFNLGAPRSRYYLDR